MRFGTTFLMRILFSQRFAGSGGKVPAEPEMFLDVFNPREGGKERRSGEARFIKEMRRASPRVSAGAHPF
jgi:hypothetical protein